MEWQIVDKIRSFIKKELNNVPNTNIVESTVILSRIEALSKDLIKDLIHDFKLERMNCIVNFKLEKNTAQFPFQIEDESHHEQLLIENSKTNPKSIQPVSQNDTLSQNQLPPQTVLLKWKTVKMQMESELCGFIRYKLKHNKIDSLTNEKLRFKARQISTRLGWAKFKGGMVWLKGFFQRNRKLAVNIEMMRLKDENKSVIQF